MKPTTPPQPGDVVYVDTDDAGQPKAIWHQHEGVLRDLSSDTLADVSQPDHVVIRGKQQQNIYQSPQDWQVVANDEGESSPKMRRARVQAWAF